MRDIADHRLGSCVNLVVVSARYHHRPQHLFIIDDELDDDEAVIDGEGFLDHYRPFRRCRCSETDASE